MTRDAPRPLPATPEEARACGAFPPDVLLITPDAYVDHPSYGVAVIGRVLQQAGFSTVVVCRPDHRSPESLRRFGTPRLFVGVTGGQVDSNLNNYTASRHKRRGDVYGWPDAPPRPAYATAVYANLAKQAFPGVPVVLGGIEASTRRFAYYDFVAQKLRRSVLVDTRADILVCGPGERQVLAIARRLAAGRDLDGIDGTARLVPNSGPVPAGAAWLPDYPTIAARPGEGLLEQTHLLDRDNPVFSRSIWAQRYDEGVVVCTPPPPYTTEDLDAYAALPYTRRPHPLYAGTPGFRTVAHSIIAQRGCPGGCAFCSIALHAGRRVVSRSPASLVDEALRIAATPGFAGTITDVGGPTANTFGATIAAPERCAACKRPSCLHPAPCSNLRVDQESFVAVLDRIRTVPHVRHVFVASGIRHDLALQSPPFIAALAAHYTGGHLKAAPEHACSRVLARMRKPDIAVFETFEAQFLAAAQRAGKELYVVPYCIAGHPGADPAAADELARWLSRRGQRLQQVQLFIPLPGTTAQAEFVARKDHRGAPVFVADDRERKRQKDLLTSPFQRRSAPQRTGGRHGRSPTRPIHGPGTRTGRGRSSRR